MNANATAIACSSLVFDLDGTLSDPSLGITRCFNHALKAHGLPEVEPAHIERHIGPPLDQAFRKLAPAPDDLDINALVGSYRERYADLGFAENTIYPGIREALTDLAQLDIPMGVCTSKRRDFAEKILDLFDIQVHFDFVSGGDVGISKSSQLAELLDTSAIDAAAIMIGDRSIDIESARENQLRGVGVLWGFGDYPELSAAFPLCILDETRSLSDAFAS